MMYLYQPHAAAVGAPGITSRTGARYIHTRYWYLVPARYLVVHRPEKWHCLRVRYVDYSSGTALLYATAHMMMR